MKGPANFFEKKTRAEPIIAQQTGFERAHMAPQSGAGGDTSVLHPCPMHSPKASALPRTKFGQPDIPIGLTFTTFHFPDLVDINLITNDEWDRDSGTAEFKAASIRVEKLSSATTSNQ